jgi:hypothetical protein
VHFSKLASIYHSLMFKVEIVSNRKEYKVFRKERKNFFILKNSRSQTSFLSDFFKLFAVN